MPADRTSPASDSSSQSGTADIETEPEQTRLSPPQLIPPPKKKRTRTLTTPHQSAVLHALLAKSRFPTTAMREEVGRQIGLSARKVQIWFQNQRQKARRPPTESSPLSRPPQFGPFPIVTPAGPSASPPTGETSHSTPSSAQSAASLDSNPPLSGPGIPNWPSSYQTTPPSTEHPDPPRRPPTGPETSLGSSHQPRSSQGISAHAINPGLPPYPSLSNRVETSPRILPPISISLIDPRSSTEPHVSAASSFPLHRPSRSSVNFNATQLEYPPTRPATEHGSPVRSVIPPPIVLQPQPQWDPLTFTPYTRPQFASWLQPSGSPLPSIKTTPSTAAVHDRVTHPPSPVPRRRHFYPSFSDPVHHPTPSVHSRCSTSASSSVSRDGHTNSDDEGRDE